MGFPGTLWPLLAIPISDLASGLRGAQSSINGSMRMQNMEKLSKRPQHAEAAAEADFTTDEV